MSDEKKPDDPFSLPKWIHDCCSHDARAQAWATMQVAQQIHDLTDAVDSLHQKLDGIEKSLDLIDSDLANAGRGS
jgi:hypothetical protein